MSALLRAPSGLTSSSFMPSVPGSDRTPLGSRQLKATLRSMSLTADADKSLATTYLRAGQERQYERTSAVRRG